MQLSSRELITALHGMVFGGIFLLSFSGAFLSLYTLRADWVHDAGARAHLRCAVVTAWIAAICSWASVLIGTFVIYPWYRAKPLDAAPADLARYPKYLLLASSSTAQWHHFGMEWKEHVAWLAPILATAVAVVAGKSGRLLLGNTKLRNTLLFMLSVSFVCGVIAGTFGALINKMAPVH